MISWFEEYKEKEGGIVQKLEDVIDYYKDMKIVLNKTLIEQDNLVGFRNVNLMY